MQSHVSVTRLSRTAFVVAGLGTMIWCSQLLGGPLTPPAGPVTSTGKTITEVEPRIAISATNTPGDADSVYRIAQPGSYYLTENIGAPAGKSAIEIASGGVTLDLNGFTISSAAALEAIRATVEGLTNITIRNGNIGPVSGAGGIDVRPGLFATSLSTGGRIENIHVSNTARYGILAGDSLIVHNCTVNRCENGIRVESGCTMTECSSSDNTGSGIEAGGACVVRSCSASGNTLTGIGVSGGSTISDCTAYDNGGDGIVAFTSCFIHHNIVRLSGSRAGGDGAGIRVSGSDNRIEDNQVLSSDRGIQVNVAGNIILRNTCSGNTTNWVIAANNVCGPIIDRTVPASAAINGNSAPDSTGSTHPNANFTY